jgi:cyanophycinase
MRGTLILIGGDEDKRDAQSILRRVVDEAGAGGIAVITTASSIPQELGQQYRQAFDSLGARRVHVLDIRRGDEADRPEHLEVVRASAVVFFSGGDQHQLVTTLEDTALIRQVRQSFAAGAVIAGTSAGAAAAGEVTIFNGDDQGLVRGAVRHSPGFNFLPGVIVDTHFVERGRIYRLAQALAAGLCPRGVGLAEDTALVVRPGGSGEVIGSGVATLLDAGPLSHSDAAVVPAGATVSLDGLRLGFLSAGTGFDLESWTVRGDSNRPAVPAAASPASKRGVVRQVRALFGKSEDPGGIHPIRR